MYYCSARCKSGPCVITVFFAKEVKPKVEVKEKKRTGILDQNAKKYFVDVQMLLYFLPNNLVKQKKVTKLWYVDKRATVKADTEMNILN